MKFHKLEILGYQNLYSPSECKKEKNFKFLMLKLASSFLAYAFNLSQISSFSMQTLFSKN
jgi:hypothetical protein